MFTTDIRIDPTAPLESRRSLPGRLEFVFAYWVSFPYIGFFLRRTVQIVTKPNATTECKGSQTTTEVTVDFSKEWRLAKTIYKRKIRNVCTPIKKTQGSEARFRRAASRESYFSRVRISYPYKNRTIVDNESNDTHTLNTPTLRALP